MICSGVKNHGRVAKCYVETAQQTGETIQVLNILQVPLDMMDMVPLTKEEKSESRTGTS